MAAKWAECCEENTSLRQQLTDARRTAEYWKAEHLASNEQLSEAAKANEDCEHNYRNALDSVSQQITESDKDTLRLLETIKYLQGIAVRGSGTDMPNDQTVEQFVLGYVMSLEQQLSAALAACKVKDKTLEYISQNYDENDYDWQIALDALAIQPDDTALKAWLGEPATHQYQDRGGEWKPFLNDEHRDNTAKSGQWNIRALYTAPKGMK